MHTISKLRAAARMYDIGSLPATVRAHPASLRSRSFWLHGVAATLLDIVQETYPCTRRKRINRWLTP